MNRATSDNAGAAVNRRAGAAPRVRGLVLGLAFFAAGTALSAMWFARAPSRQPAAPESAGQPALSEATRAVLRRLGSPVEIRFYSLLDAASASESVQAFSGRVDQLLAQYEQEAAGKIKVIRSKILSPASANAALADGIKPFDLDKGDGCYLGIAVVRAQQKETLSPLAPEWEQALEPDLTRAIARAIAGDSEALAPPSRGPCHLGRGQAVDSKPGFCFAGAGQGGVAPSFLRRVQAGGAGDASQGQGSRRPFSSGAGRSVRGRTGSGPK